MKVLQAIQRMFDNWRTKEEQESWANMATLGTITSSGYSTSNLGMTIGPTQTTTTNAATNALANWQLSNAQTAAASYNTYSTLGSGLMGSGSITFGPTTYASGYKMELTNEQLDRFLTFMEQAMKHSWTCKCGRQYAPLTPDCEFCNVIDRLEGIEKEAAV